MKKILVLTMATVFALGAQAQNKADEMIKMNAEKHDFGKIVQNTPVNYAFEIKNISNAPVVVENSWASCGCTTPERIVDPILPGTSAKLKVQYNAAAVGVFTKDVYIKIAGVDQPKTVQITGEVLTQEAYDAQKGGKKPSEQPQPQAATEKKPAATTNGGFGPAPVQKTNN
ncbi:MAG: hypothetical protein RJA57_1242 [Bacteroidota bacterium]